MSGDTACNRREGARTLDARSRHLGSLARHRLTPLAMALALLVLVPRARADLAEPEYVLDGSRVFWFVQITDTHVDTIFPGSDQRITWALTEGIPTVAPDFVVNTGDLTDSTNGIIYGLGPYQSEWTRYRDYLDEAGLTPDYYFDLPGNHDQYGDEALRLYRDYSMWGSATDGTQPQWIVEYPFGRYLFFGVATPGNDGAQWPFDHTTFTDWELAELRAALTDYGDEADLVFLFGHHDFRDTENWEAFLETVAPYQPRFYAHGHVHDHAVTLDEDGIVRYRIDSLGQSRADNFAVWAVDANAVSVGVWDAGDAWPAVVITAPVDAVLVDVDNPYAPPVPNTCTRAPVRALVFDTEPVEEVVFRWDEGPWIRMDPWPDLPQQWRGTFDATELSEGAHELTVEAVGSAVRRQTIQVWLVDEACAVGDEDPPAEDAGPDPADAAEPPAEDAGDAGAGDAGADGAELEPDAPIDEPDAGHDLLDGAPTSDTSGPDDGGLDIEAWDGVDADGEPPAVPPSGGSEQVKKEPGCGCASEPARPLPPAWSSILLLTGLATLRRRSRRDRRPDRGSPST